ncbi:MAG: hypothetical protein IT200_16985 [Thermoleophilia bacterium]|nr:hypothetical protein [Thermoleophilia bacterium]
MTGLTVTLSDQLAEIDAAMVLVHDGFVESGFMDPEPSGRRVIPHYLTPGTFFALTHLDGVPIGAMSVIPDGPWGLPSAHAFGDAMAAAAELGPVVEVGSLVVAAEHRSLTRQVVMHQVAGVIRVLHARGDDPVPFITVAPEQARFHTALFGLERFGAERPLYGVPAVGLANRISQVAEHVFLGGTMARRTVAGLVSEPQPRWLRNRLADRAPLPVPEPVGDPGAEDRRDLVSGASGAA